MEKTAEIDQVPPISAKPKSEKNYLLYIVIGLLSLVVLAALAGLALGSALILNYQRKALPPIPVSSPSGQTTTVPRPKSKFSTDSAVLKMNSDMLKLQEDINKTDYFEAPIAPPAIDTNIKIE